VPIRRAPREVKEQVVYVMTRSPADTEAARAGVIFQDHLSLTTANQRRADIFYVDRSSHKHIHYYTDDVVCHPLCESHIEGEGHFLTYPASQYPNPGLNIPAGVNYPDKKVPIPDTPGYPFSTPLAADRAPSSA
jgi:hypothetical protein